MEKLACQETFGNIWSHVIDDESSLLMMLMSKYPKLTLELLTSSRKNALEKYKKNASFLYGFFCSLLSTICEVSYYRKILMYFSQKGSLCLQMSVWKQMWVKVDLLSFFFKVSNKVQFESFFINSLPNFLRSSDLSK